jgi:hypothetical protein
MARQRRGHLRGVSLTLGGSPRCSPVVPRWVGWGAPCVDAVPMHGARWAVTCPHGVSLAIFSRSARALRTCKPTLGDWARQPGQVRAHGVVFCCGHARDDGFARLTHAAGSDAYPVCAGGGFVAPHSTRDGEGDGGASGEYRGRRRVRCARRRCGGRSSAMPDTADIYAAAAVSARRAVYGRAEQLWRLPCRPCMCCGYIASIAPGPSGTLHVDRQGGVPLAPPLATGLCTTFGRRNHVAHVCHCCVVQPGSRCVSRGDIETHGWRFESGLVQRLMTFMLWLNRWGD